MRSSSSGHQNTILCWRSRSFLSPPWRLALRLSWYVGSSSGIHVKQSSISNAVQVIEWGLYSMAVFLVFCRFGVHIRKKTLIMLGSDIWLLIALLDCTALIACDTVTYRADAMNLFLSAPELVRKVRVVQDLVRSSVTSKLITMDSSDSRQYTSSTGDCISQSLACWHSTCASFRQRLPRCVKRCGQWWAS